MRERKHKGDGKSFGHRRGQPADVGKGVVDGRRNFGACVRVRARVRKTDERTKAHHRSFRRPSKRDSRYVRYPFRAQLLVRGYGVGVSVSRARPQKVWYVRDCVRACVFQL